MDGGRLPSLRALLHFWSLPFPTPPSPGSLSAFGCCDEGEAKVDASPRCPCLWWNFYAELDCSLFEAFYRSVLGGCRHGGIFTRAAASGSTGQVQMGSQNDQNGHELPWVPDCPLQGDSNLFLLLPGPRSPTWSRCPIPQDQAGAWNERLPEKPF